MKRTVALTILGIAMANNVFAQGHVLADNYSVSPYNQVVFDGGLAVNDNSVTLSWWVAPGSNAVEGSLIPSLSSSFNVNPGITYNPFPAYSGTDYGAGGYYDPQIVLTPGVGDFTIQMRATGAGIDPVASRSALFNITSGGVASPASLIGDSIGLSIIVPEPTTFALAGLGAAALLIFRRRD